MCGCLVGQRRFIVIPLGTIDALNCHEVRICALPASWYCCSMEVHHEMMACCTFQEVDAILHCLLLVSSKEVNLHTCHSHLLEPCELSFSVFWCIESLMRSRSTPLLNPCRRTVIPQQRLDSIVEGISDGIFDVATILHLIPLGIDKHVRQIQLNSHINIFLHYLIVVAAMIICPVDPRHATWHDP